MTDIELIENLVMHEAPVGFLIRDIDNGPLQAVEIYVDPAGILTIITEEE